MDTDTTQISSILAYGVTLQLFVLAFIGLRYLVGRARRSGPKG